MSVHLSRPGVTGHQIRRLLRNEGRAGFLLSEAPRGQERYRLADRGRYAVGELATSARFERLNMPDAAVPIAVDDVVDALRAHLPLLELPAGLENQHRSVLGRDRVDRVRSGPFRNDRMFAGA
jgi:hypothetical protein